MSRHATKVVKDYLRREIKTHESNFSDQKQHWSFANVLKYAKDDLKLDKQHEMGVCILTFESINKYNPLSTNQSIATISKGFRNVHDPIYISCSYLNINEQFNESIQNHRSKVFPNVIQCYTPSIEICPIHDVNVFSSNDFYENCTETDDSFKKHYILSKGEKEPTTPRALFQNWH